MISLEKLFEKIKDHLLSSMALTLNGENGRTETLAVLREERNGDGVRLVYEGALGGAEIDAVIGEKTVTFFLHAHVQADAAFTPGDAVTMRLGDMEPEAMLGSFHDKLWWMMPSYPKTFADILSRTQSLFVKNGETHYHILPLCGDNFRCELQEGLMRLSSDMEGLRELSGAFLSVSAAEDPFDAVAENYRAARARGGIRVPLRSERVFPELFEGFGFCTWDAFYQNITSEKVYRKLDEIKEKHIPVKWMILDDGWLTIEDGKLADFAADPQKFPEGLKETVRRIKEDYGIEKVGVWHTFNGYWNGISYGSPLWEAQKENLMRTPSGVCLPALDEEKAFRFWDAWHTYLADCGIDFLKVDNQSSNSTFLAGVIPTAEGCRICHNALERSVFKNFGGAIIDCMGMDMENVLARPKSAVSRNSDDFFPRMERGFIKHLKQNVYSTVWHGQIHFCDFDMWWSEHESAAQSGVLRAISGSPIYVSDEVGRSCRETILPVVEDDGTVMRCEEPAQPTRDCLYIDCTEAGKLLKVWNRSGSCYGIAAFNVSDGDITDTVDFSQVPVWKDEGDYVAYEYFTKTWKPVNRRGTVTLTLPKDGVAVWSIYPVEQDAGGAFALVGSTEKYLPIASKHKTKKMLSELFH